MDYSKISRFFATTILPLFLFLYSLLISHGVMSQSDRLYAYCPNTTLYTPNTTYQSNLNTLLSSLSSSTANAPYASGFFNSTAGTNTPRSSTVYGLFLCRGDVTADDCRACVSRASTEILDLCPNRRVAVVWYDNCLLRYSDQYIFSRADQSVRQMLYNTQNVTDRERFVRVLGDVLDDVATRASSSRGELGKKFATGEANFTALQRLYCLAQCTPDLSDSDCNTCLRDAIANLPSRSQGARVLFPSCNVRYEVYPFYRIVAPPPSPTPRRLPPPPPPPPPSPGTEAEL